VQISNSAIYNQSCQRRRVEGLSWR
jgi:hypothetical protein